MIASDIYDLEQYIISEAKCNAKFGDPDLGADQYPFIKIRMVEDFDIFRENQKTLTLDLPLELRLIVSEGNELKALEVLERLLLKINQFKPQMGSQTEGTGTPEYVEETKTFEISILYNLKQLIHDT
jgi:hypothetical protein